MHQKCSLLDCITRGTFEHAEIFACAAFRARYDANAKHTENRKVFANENSNTRSKQEMKNKWFFEYSEQGLASQCL